jgi:zinc transporter ZupT
MVNIFNFEQIIQAFTASCPLSAFLVYLILKFINDKTDPNTLMFWVGILLIVSAGSFIYVATLHILPEVMGSSKGHEHFEHSQNSERDEKLNEKPDYSITTELLVMITGLMLPYFLLFLHDD